MDAARSPGGGADAGGGTDRRWWSEQWLDLINSYRFKKRLERGWKYAREGHVLWIRFQDQTVLSQVQGTEVEPYQVSIWLDVLSDEDWDYIIASLSQRAVFSAKLLAGEMPHNIEDAFSANGKRLFPFNLSEVRSRCSCPDKANPCKHVSALYYLMGDRFSEDPFVLFQLRGRTREQILAALREKRGVEAGATALPPAPPPATDPGRFWGYDAPLDPSLVVIVPSGGETPLDRLGAPALSSDPAQTEQLRAYLQMVYQQVAQRAMLQGMAGQDS